MKTARKKRRQAPHGVAAAGKNVASAPAAFKSSNGTLPPKPVAAKPTKPPVHVSAVPPQSTAPTPPSPAFQPKVYAPGDITCPHQNDDYTNCGAEAGEPCKWQQPGMEGTFHAERIANAASASQRPGIKPTKEQFDDVVLNSGLV